jgi:hypothetical protein
VGDEHQANDGGIFERKDPLFSFAPITPASDSSSGGGAVSDAAANAIAGAQTVGRRRGRPPGSGASSAGRTRNAQSQSADMSPELRAELMRSMEACYDPKAWGALLGAPADAAAAITGKDYWKISDEERHTLGACGSTASRYCVAFSSNEQSQNARVRDARRGINERLRAALDAATKGNAGKEKRRKEESPAPMKRAKKYLVARQSRVASSDGKNHNVFATVEAYSQMHALERLAEHFPNVPFSDWNFLDDELDKDHFLGGMGTDLPPLNSHALH